MIILIIEWKRISKRNCRRDIICKKQIDFSLLFYRWGRSLIVTIMLLLYHLCKLTRSITVFLGMIPIFTQLVSDILIVGVVPHVGNSTFGKRSQDANNEDYRCQLSNHFAMANIAH